MPSFIWNMFQVEDQTARSHLQCLIETEAQTDINNARFLYMLIIINGTVCALAASAFFWNLHWLHLPYFRGWIDCIETSQQNKHIPSMNHYTWQTTCMASMQQDNTDKNALQTSATFKHGLIKLAMLSNIKIQIKLLMEFAANIHAGMH